MIESSICAQLFKALYTVNLSSIRWQNKTQIPPIIIPKMSLCFQSSWLNVGVQVALGLGLFVFMLRYRGRKRKQLPKHVWQPNPIRFFGGMTKSMIHLDLCGKKSMIHLDLCTKSKIHLNLFIIKWSPKNVIEFIPFVGGRCENWSMDTGIIDLRCFIRSSSFQKTNCIGHAG